ncbi:hypothetical protein [Alteribacter natronophilus]|nr:hypothetical protein [Alteribacter natronophilus]
MSRETNKNPKKNEQRPSKRQKPDQKLHYQMYIQDDYPHHPKDEEEMEY